MGRNYGLSNTEMLIMELLWRTGEPMSFKEIMDVAQNEWKKNMESANFKHVFDQFAKNQNGRNRPELYTLYVLCIV